MGRAANIFFCLSWLVLVETVQGRKLSVRYNALIDQLWKGKKGTSSKESNYSV
jgi:hypothetical protein